MTFDGLRAVPKPERKPKKVTRVKVGGCGQRAKRSGGHLFEKYVDMPRRKWIASNRCFATGKRTGELVHYQPWMPKGWRELCPYRCKVIAAHVKGRGASGKDAGNMVPLDDKIHLHIQHTQGWDSFEKKIGVMSRFEIAAEYERRYLARAAMIARNMEKAGR